MVLVHVAVGAGLPSTLQTIEIVSFSLTEKSELGTVPMILALAVNKCKRPFFIKKKSFYYLNVASR